MAYYRWICTQTGARELYAVPRAFYRRERLARLYTDFWAKSNWLRYFSGLLGEPFRGVSRRYHPELPNNLVNSFNASAVLAEVRAKLSVRIKSDPDVFYLYWARVLRKFGSDICNHLRRHKLDGPGPYALYAYSYGALELLEYAKEAGYFSVLNQIDLSMVELEIVAQERLKWPGWETPLEHICKTNFERLKTEHSRAEWSKANLIVVNSEWSKQALVGDSVPAEKIVVVPLAYEPEPGVTAHVCENVDRPLNILWIGQVNLRKGIPYLIEAAKLLPSVRFTVAGPVFVNENMLKTAPKNTQFIGRVNRAQAHKLYSDADVFVLPTISDGFALTQLEAMAHGLPVIATLRCGKVVTDGVDGLIIPFGDSAMLAGAIAKLDQDRKLISELSRNAPAKAAKFTLEACANAIEAAAHP